MLDNLARVSAWALSKFTRISAAGAFVERGGSSLWDAGAGRSGSYILRLGCLELVADYRTPM